MKTKLKKNSKKNSTVIISAIVLVLVFAIGGVMYKNKQTQNISFMAKSNFEVFVRPHSQTLGADTAKVTIIEFMDPGCETCRAFAPFIKSAIDTFPGKIKLVIRYAPLHQGADFMCMVLEAARLQGKYWETLALMYETQSVWASHSNPQPQLIWNYLPKLDLDIEKLKKDINSPEVQRIVKQDIADSKTLKVHKTPGFFVNGKPLVTFGSEQLKNLILTELQLQYPDQK